MHTATFPPHAPLAAVRARVVGRGPRFHCNVVLGRGKIFTCTGGVEKSMRWACFFFNSNLCFSVRADHEHARKTLAVECCVAADPKQVIKPTPALPASGGSPAQHQKDLGQQGQAKEDLAHLPPPSRITTPVKTQAACGGHSDAGLREHTSTRVHEHTSTRSHEHTST